MVSDMAKISEDEILPTALRAFLYHAIWRGHLTLEVAGQLVTEATAYARRAGDLENLDIDESMLNATDDIARKLVERW